MITYFKIKISFGVKRNTGIKEAGILLTLDLIMLLEPRFLYAHYIIQLLRNVVKKRNLIYREIELDMESVLYWIYPLNKGF